MDETACPLTCHVVPSFNRPPFLCHKLWRKTNTATSQWSQRSHAWRLSQHQTMLMKRNKKKKDFYTQKSGVA